MAELPESLVKCGDPVGPDFLTPTHLAGRFEMVRSHLAGLIPPCRSSPPVVRSRSPAATDLPYRTHAGTRADRRIGVSVFVGPPLLASVARLAAATVPYSRSHASSCRWLPESLESVCVRSQLLRSAFAILFCWSRSPAATVLSYRTHAGSRADRRIGVRISVDRPSVALFPFVTSPPPSVSWSYVNRVADCRSL